MVGHYKATPELFTELWHAAVNGKGDGFKRNPLPLKASPKHSSLVSCDLPSKENNTMILSKVQGSLCRNLKMFKASVVASIGAGTE